jgi:antitoxin (DNA-binding transcriptional repressor) of toxin-antitoxin stability system
MLTKTVDVRKTSPHLNELLSQVLNGAEIVLTEGDKPIARWVPFALRVAGLHAGAIWTSNDFDEPIFARYPAQVVW